jgi:hypothetical protein
LLFYFWFCNLDLGSIKCYFKMTKNLLYNNVTPIIKIYITITFLSVWLKRQIIRRWQQEILLFNAHEPRFTNVNKWHPGHIRKWNVCSFPLLFDSSCIAIYLIKHVSAEALSTRRMINLHFVNRNPHEQATTVKILILFKLFIIKKIFRLWVYLVNFIPETRRAHPIWYLRFYLCWIKILLSFNSSSFCVISIVGIYTPWMKFEIKTKKCF